MSRRSKPAPRYRVRHTFAHRGVLYGPWNAEEVSDLPAHLRESLEERGRIEALPTAADAHTAAAETWGALSGMVERGRSTPEEAREIEAKSDPEPTHEA